MSFTRIAVAINLAPRAEGDGHGWLFICFANSIGSANRVVEEMAKKIATTRNLKIRIHLVSPQKVLQVSDRVDSVVAKFQSELQMAADYGEVWKIVKETVETSLGKHRVGMMLFLDDLPLQLGAYHPVGTNNIVLNRSLVEIVEASEKSKLVMNALVYNLLLHEYLHALGDLSEGGVKRTVVVIAQKCFGNDHIAAVIARKSPWSLLRNIPVSVMNAPKRVMQIVRDFEKTSKYIV